MEQSTLLASISDHMDALRTLTNTVLVVALAASWAAVMSHAHVELGILRVPRPYALVACGVAMLAITGAFLLAASRLGALLQLLDDQHVADGVSRVVTHSWLLNPFAYFGDSSLQKLLAPAGVVALMGAWCFTFTPLYLLEPSFDRGLRWAVAHLLLGFGAIALLDSRFDMLPELLQGTQPALASSLRDAHASRQTAVFLGYAVGYAIIGFAFYAKKREADRSEKEPNTA